MQLRKPTSAIRPTSLVRRVMPALTIPAPPNSARIANVSPTRAETDRLSSRLRETIRPSERRKAVDEPSGAGQTAAG
jgi:hypothetical protein